MTRLILKFSLIFKTPEATFKGIRIKSKGARMKKKSFGKYWVQYFFREILIVYREKSIRFNT